MELWGGIVRDGNVMEPMVRVEIIDRIEQFQADLTIKLLSSKRDSKDPSFTRDQLPSLSA